MVTVGFIVEGGSESILIKDDSFINFLATLNISSNKELVINADGKNNLYHPHADFTNIRRKVEGWVETLQYKGASVIFFLLDFDGSDPCFSGFKKKLFHNPENIIIIAKQALEAWYLADTSALSAYLQSNIPEIAYPESYLQPLEEIKSLRLKHRNRGVPDKKILSRDMIRSGFRLQKAAEHPNCPSASYFLNKLQSLNSGILIS